ncbi:MULTISPECIES: fimbrial adhesin FimH [Acinetobacter]|uniref:Fimbrial adhesin FimH n=1 Tax=Acinetobacter bereziniae TaxID=106648 RepID=A0A0A8TQU7_ACIBZ|nr:MULTISPECIES: fimbrial adhesin FimH [Acinetobacter]ELW78342.1 fimbrial protein [Acinetobacter sp. WC-743]MBI0394531.1 fimbrial adhesin FimH [Acinetobacter bereziniae]MBJ8423737.1 fimbrial adhesin FimH [Acinetobacter bereziniae]MBJ8425240.1 fimbrial adhesin FimH [Acinetobacter bereziniae]MCU4474789.1 fimbrial adhesin FimH [Acinetobacter bereziniae]
MKVKLLISSILLLGSTQCFAISCWNSKGQGVVDEVFYDLSNSFSSSNNAVGQIVEIRKNFSAQVYAVCEPHSSGISGNRTKRSYVTDLPVVETIGRYQYLPINDYLLGAMKITDSYAGDFYPPANYVQMGYDANVSAGRPFGVRDSNFTFRLKVIKPFIDFVPIPKKTMFTVYVSIGSGDPLIFPVYTVSYSGSVNVPQSCKIGTNDIVEIPFGDIPAYAFSNAGPGNKPSNVNVQTRTLGIQCTNINAQAMLTLRIEAERANGNMIISDNPDIGFQMSDQNNNILIPNNINSVIPFNLQQQPANVTIKAWPISITGNTPKVGPFKSRGYLRVDFE